MSDPSHPEGPSYWSWLWGCYLGSCFWHDPKWNVWAGSFLRLRSHLANVNFDGPGMLSWNLWLVSHRAGGRGARAQWLAAVVVGRWARPGNIPVSLYVWPLQMGKRVLQGIFEAVFSSLLFWLSLFRVPFLSGWSEGLSPCSLCSSSC